MNGIHDLMTALKVIKLPNCTIVFMTAASVQYLTFYIWGNTFPI